MKDKTYYMVVDGKTVRVRASQKPDKKTTEALTALIKAVSKMDLNRKRLMEN